MFNGPSALTLDAKGRMSIPSRHRDALVDPETGRTLVTLTRHPHGCLLLYPFAIWVVKREQIAKLPESLRAWRRFLLGNAVDLEMDGSGRILIPPELRKAAGLDKEVMLLGTGDHMEVWDAATKEAKEAEDLLSMPPLDSVSL